MGVPRATTPTFTLTFTDDALDLTTADRVFVTFTQPGKILTKKDGDLTVSAKQIEVYLTQDETLDFAVGVVKVQANWVFSDDSRAASEIVSVNITEQLLDKVL